MQNDRLGKYEIRGTLGKGAMGTVLDGYDPVIDRRVAIKTITLPDPNDIETQDELARFRREAQAAGRLTHPNIVAVYDYGEDETIAYIVMEYAPGTELKKILDKGDRLPPAESVRIMEGVLAGLNFSHERGVVHRDIKPGNIILAKDGTVKIADFGIARIESSSMTQAGTVMGTPAYMSPEQFMGQTVDSRTDIYSAGVMLYQLLTGERPFEGGMTAIMHKALNTEPPRPSELSVTSPSALDQVVARAMAKRPGDRFETASAFAQAIRDAMSGNGIGLSAASASASSDATMISPRGPSSAKPPSWPTPPPTPGAAQAAGQTSRKGNSRIALFAGVAVAVLALAGVGGYFVLSGGKPAQVADTVVPVSGGSLPPQTALPDTPVRPANPAPPASPAPTTPGPAAAQPTPTQPTSIPAAPTSPLPQAAQLPPTQPTPAPVAPPVAPVAPVAPVVLVTPPAPPVQVASVAATPAMIRDALATAMAPASCSLTRTSLDGRNVSISGVAGRTSEQAIRNRAREALPANAAPDAVAWRLDLFDGPYCSVIDILRPIATQPLTVGLRQNATRLRKDEDIVPQVVMPDYPAWLQIDYFSSDGGVTHLHPTQISPPKVEATRATVSFGNTAKERWQVDAPFGTDMIVAIVSSAPLFPTARLADETAPAYLQALRAAVEDAQRKGVRITGNAALVQTAER